MKLGVTLPSRAGTMANVKALATLADAARFDAQWSYEVFRNPFMVTAVAATASTHSRVGTGIVGAFSRSPFDLANSAADLDDLSDGRMMLGIGTGAREALRAFHNVHGDAPDASDAGIHRCVAPVVGVLVHGARCEVLRAHPRKPDRNSRPTATTST